MSGFVSLVLFFPRYLMVTGITVLALVFFSGQLNAMGPDVDFEQILPYVISNFIPVGLVGFTLAGLLAAFMSTFDSTVNSGAAYIVNDIYKRYINKNASDRKYVLMSYIISILIVIVGICFGFMTESINTVLTWIAAGLYGGYIAPNVLRWHWWRLNGYGYFAGMIAGIVSALALPNLLPSLTALESFPINLALSTVASVVVSLLTPADTDETLKGFYKQVRPWGFWRPIHLKVITENPDFATRASFKRDAINVVVGIVWQLMFTTIPIFLLIRQYRPMVVCIVILTVTSVFLKYNWYDKLEKD
jgi:Na+/proline symporter